MGHFVLIVFWIVAIWLIRADTKRRPGISTAVWIPTLWVMILASRPVSTWVGFSGGADTQEGNAMDRVIYFALIAMAYYVLVRRDLKWSQVIADSWPVFLFYGYLLVSTLWADSTFVSFKRWFKEFGNIVVALVVLTEVDWQQAMRAVFVRCAYVLLPLSVIFVRYFPDLGRRYSVHSGLMEVTGVTFQKNALGALVLVCGLILVWDWFERSRPEAVEQRKYERYLPVVMLLIGAYLLYECNSKTSISCLVIGIAILTATRLPFLRNLIGQFGGLSMLACLGLYGLNSIFGIEEWVVKFLGRDMTFTGRTDVWRALLKAKTDPVIGVGFCSFWDDPHFQSQLPEWLANGRSAHDGYLELYLDGGMLSLFFLAIMLVAVGLRINRQLASSGNYAVVRFAVFIAMIIGNVSESHFARLSPLGFLFLLVALEEVQPNVDLVAESALAEELPAEDSADGELGAQVTH